MAESEKITLEVEVKASGAVKELENVEKAANKAGEGLEGLKDTGEVSGNALVSSLKRLAGTFGLVLSAGAVVSFIKRVSEANLLLGQMAVRSGQSEKSIRAMQNQFKALGYSASEANSIVDDLAGSFAALKFGGELTGITKAFTDLGVSVMDAQGKARDLYDMAIEAGEFSLGFTGGDRESAMQLMMSRGISPALADMATRSDARDQARKMREEAAASKEASEQAEKLSRNLSRIGERFVAFINRLDESYGIFDKLNKALDALVPLGDGVYHVFDAIGKALTVIGNILKAVIKPIVNALGWLGNFIDKGDKEGFGIDELGTGPDDLDESVKKGAKAVGKKLESAGETADELHKSGFANDVGGFFEKLGEWGWDVDKWGGGADTGAATRGGRNASKAMLDLISKGEGNYNSVNLGQKKGYRASTRNLTKMTLGEVIQRMTGENKDFNAAGRYQFLRSTLVESMKSAGLGESDLFNEDNQDKLALAAIKNKKSVWDYITGKSLDIGKAAIGMSQIWASIANPKTGRSYYDTTGVNKASITSAQIMTQLQAMREQYKESGSVNKNNAFTQNINIYAPSSEPNEIIAEYLRKTPNIGAITSSMV